MEVAKKFGAISTEIFGKELTRQSGQEPVTLAPTCRFFVVFLDFWLMQNFGVDYKSQSYLKFLIFGVIR